MKTIFIITICAVLAKSVLCDGELTRLTQVYKDCMSESKADRLELERFLKNGISGKPATSDIKCYFKCTMEKLQHMKDGVLDVDAAMKFWTAIPGFKPYLAKISESYKVCKPEKGTDDCSTAFRISVCLEENGFNIDMLKSS